MNALDVQLISTPLVRFGFNFSGVYPMPHLGLGYLGAIFADAGMRLEYLDSQLPRQNVLFNPQVLKPAGVYALTAKIMNLAPTHEIARVIRKTYPGARIILGGPCNVITPEIIFDQFPAFDILATGEGENIALPLVRALLDGKRNEDLLDIEGLALRIDGRVEKTRRAPPADLNVELHPLRTLWDYKIHKMHPPYGVYPPVSLVETSRGCSFDCSFCVISKVFRERPVEFVKREVEDLVMKDVYEIHFVDPTFTLNRKRTQELCEALLTIPRRFHWTCKTRTDCVTPELLALMARSGCYLIAYGVESASDEVLAAMKKQISASVTKDALQWTHDAGIRSIGYLLVGSEGDTDASVDFTNRFLKKTKCTFVLFGISMPGPRSAPVDAEGKSLEPELVRWYTTGELGPFTENAPSGFPHKTLNAWLTHSIRSFYLSPGTIGKILFGIRSPREVIHYAKGAFLILIEFMKYAFRRIGIFRKDEIRYSDGNR